MANDRKKPAIAGTRNHSRLVPGKSSRERVQHDLKLAKDRLAMLRLERSKLRQELESLRQERDEYRKIAYAWAHKLMDEIGPGEFPREEDCIPFSQLIADVDTLLIGARR